MQAQLLAFLFEAAQGGADVDYQSGLPVCLLIVIVVLLVL